MADSLQSIEDSDVERFYRAALLGLHALDRREQGGRRLGADGDARWQQFRGALTAADRIDWLLRDAAKTQPLGFAPQSVWDLPGLSSDEPIARRGVKPSITSMR
jgi:hypothetical protein